MYSDEQIREITEIINNPLINRSVLARLMYPHNSKASVALYNKLRRFQYAKITEEDCKKIIDILNKEFIKKIESINPN